VHLIDTSAWNRLGHGPALERFEELVEADEAAICTVVRLEVLNGAHGKALVRETTDALDGLEHLDLDHVITDRALEVQRTLLGRRGRRPKAADYLIAATAELHEAVVLHHDADFDAIAAVTGQLVERIP